MELTTLAATAPMVQPVGQEVVIAALGAAGLVLVALIQTLGAKRRVNREVDAQPETAAPPPIWNGDPLALNRFIQDTVEVAVERATRPLKDELAALRGSVRVMRQFVRHLRRAFREYMQDVEASWGKTDRPPKVSPDVLAMLYDDDGLDDTLTGDDVRRIRERGEEPPP
jgi:uncharacterized membrane protein YccC